MVNENETEETTTIYPCRCFGQIHGRDCLIARHFNQSMKVSIKDLQGKQTSEGYEPKPGEKVELRGD